LKWIEFSEDMKLGVPSMDAQHEKLVDLINDLMAADAEGMAPGKTEEILDQLSDYIAVHFQAEEKLLETVAFPELEQHKKRHVEFIQRVEGLKQDFHSGEVSVGVELLVFLTGWLIDHIKGEDRNYASLAKEKGF
jgi:hemerythrin